MTLPRIRFDIRQAGFTLLVAYGIVAALSAVCYGLFTRPMILEFRAVSEENTPFRRAVQRKEAQVVDLERYAEALDRAQANLLHLRRDILATKNRRMVAVQLELAALAQQFAIDLEQVTYENEPLPEEGLERFGMVVPLEGGYQNLRSFIQAVEKSTQFLVIERVALGQSSTGGVVLQLNITLATYFDAPVETSRRERSQRRM